MKKPTSAYLFVVLISLAIVGFAFFIIFVGLGDMWYILPAIITFIVVGFFMYIAKAINTAHFEERLKIRMECPYCKEEIGVNSDFCPKCGKNLHEKLKCEYCGHLNLKDATVCENCNANIS